jgi:hypothetical protein
VAAGAVVRVGGVEPHIGRIHGVGGYKTRSCAVASVSACPDIYRKTAFPAETTEALLEGHVRAFAYFGGVPTRILYDNTKIAVARIWAELPPSLLASSF